jgi:DNA-binding transcriptional ArsR family regulator
VKNPDFNTMLSFFKLVSNESRLKLLGILSLKEHSVEELAAMLKLKEPTISHHLNKLKELNLVQMRHVGNTHLYKLNNEMLQELNKTMFTPEQMASLVGDVKEEAWEDKVLKSFLNGEKIEEIPASRKKRWVVLKWLVNKFETEIKYPEKTLNQIIKNHHPDCATLRRELIGYQMMQRENGIYWKLPETQWKLEEGL